MKRLTIGLILVLALALAACSPQNEEARELAGDWSGDLQTAGGGTIPVNFTISASGEIEDSTFNVVFAGDDFSYQVSSEVRNSQFWLKASATHVDLGFANLTLEGIVGTDEITGTFDAEAELHLTDGTVSYNESGSFRIERTALD